jgi:hypothetical protein
MDCNVCLQIWRSAFSSKNRVSCEHGVVKMIVPLLCVSFKFLNGKDLLIVFKFLNGKDLLIVCVPFIINQTPAAGGDHCHGPQRAAISGLW